MRRLILGRVFWMVPTLLAISLLSFAIIQLPPGDFLTSYIAAKEATGEPAAQEEVAALRERYGIGRPFFEQYLRWMAGLLRGDLGESFEYRRPVSSLIGESLFITLVLSVLTILFTWVVAIPIGIYSAVRQYSLGDYLFTTMGFVGLAVPDFLLALVLMFVGYAVFGVSPGGLFSPEYLNAPWSVSRFLDMLAHLWIPVVILGTSSTAATARIVRANLLDELRKPYVVTARAKGLPPWKLLLKYPVRVALNPLASTVGWLLPYVVSGSVIVSVVLSLPTTGPMLVQSFLSQDMYLAGSMVMFLAVLTVVGTLLSDLLLLWLDPRTRFGGKD